MQLGIKKIILVYGYMQLGIKKIILVYGYMQLGIKKNNYTTQLPVKGL